MRDSLLYNNKFQFFIRLLTALSFGLFAAYQIFLTLQIEENRIGRLIGIPFYLVLTIASFLMFADNRKAGIARTILFVGGMTLLVFVNTEQLLVG